MLGEFPAIVTPQNCMYFGEEVKLSNLRGTP